MVTSQNEAKIYLILTITYFVINRIQLKIVMFLYNNRDVTIHTISQAYCEGVAFSSKQPHRCMYSLG